MSSLIPQDPVDPAVQTALKNQHVYLLFAKEVGPLVKAKYPTIQKVQFNQILGRIWNEMPTSERDKYHQKAEYQQNQQKLSGVQTSIKQEQSTLEPSASEPLPTSPASSLASNVYSMEIPNNSNVKRIFLQRVENPNSPAVSNASTSLPYPAPTSATISNSYPAQMSYSASPQPSIDESIAHIPKTYKTILPKVQNINNPQDLMKQYPMFPMYYRNMYTTLKKIYSDKSEEELKLKAFAMFQEMLLSDRQYYSSSKTAPEPAQLATLVGHNMPLLTSEGIVAKSVTPPPQLMQQSPTVKMSQSSPKPTLQSPRGVRAPTAFNYFTREMYPLVHAQYSNLKTKEKTQLLGKMWSKMSEVEKSKYCKLSKDENTRLTGLLNNKNLDPEKTGYAMFREEETPAVQNPLEGVDPLVQPPAVGEPEPTLEESSGVEPLEKPVTVNEPEPTLEETSSVVDNDNISDEYQITIKQEPFTEPVEEELITEAAETEAAASKEENVSHTTPIKIKTERIEIESCESIVSQDNLTTDTTLTMDTCQQESTFVEPLLEETAQEIKDPNTQVIFHNLDFFIKTEPKEIESEEVVDSRRTSEDDVKKSSGLETSKEITEQKPIQDSPELNENTETSKAEKDDFLPIVEKASPSKLPLPFENTIEEDSTENVLNKQVFNIVEKADTKDELKSLIGALVSKKIPDREVIRKIVTKTRSNLSETDAPVVSYRRTQRMDLEKSQEEVIPGQVLYCYCRSSSSKNLIGCDFCPEWFHPKCLGLSKYELKMVLSLSNWKCPECIKNSDVGRKSAKDLTKINGIPKIKTVSPKNKTPPVSYNTPPVKARRMSTTSEKIALVDHSDYAMSDPVKEHPKPVERASTPEIVSSMVKQDSKPKCDTCQVLVDEVKRRGEIIEKMAKRIEMLENNTTDHINYQDKFLTSRL